MPSVRYVIDLANVGCSASRLSDLSLTISIPTAQLSQVLLCLPQLSANMAFSPSLTNAFFLVALLAVLLPAETYAFGAGDIPDFAYLNGEFSCSSTRSIHHNSS